MQCSERVPVELDAEAGPGRHGDGPVIERQHAGHDDVLGLPRVVGVAGVGEVRRRGGEVHHRGERDPEVGVAVHRQPHPERLGDAAEQRGPPEPAPQVVVGQHDLDGVLARSRAAGAQSR